MEIDSNPIYHISGLNLLISKGDDKKRPSSVKEAFFVEAKKKSDSLLPSQIMWMFDAYPEIPVCICFTDPS